MDIMDINEKRDRNAATGKVIVLESQATEDPLLPPWMFRHDDLIKALASAKLIEKKKLTNTINYIHFLGGHIFVLLRHPLYEEGILVKAHPEPCLGEELTCHWDKTYAGYNLERYHFQYLIISHDQSFIAVPARLLSADSDGITLQLPEHSHVISKRQYPRFACRDVKAELWQNGFQAEGELIDFSPQAFRIRVQPAPPSSFHWFNYEAPSTIRLSNGKDIFFSGNCSCIHQKQNGRSREIVLAPTQEQIKRFHARVLRNPRRQPATPLYAIFEHPFVKKKVQREIFDISTSGFSICEKTDEGVLMPGMIIPDTNIAYAGILKIRCKTQVIYRKEEDARVRFGMAILDMDLTNYNSLTQLLNNISGAGRGMTNEIDLDELWELFFDTDFIYPGKYKHIQAFREDFQETYRKLYEDAPEIAKHFSYQKNGRIYSHISMLRAYERAWMIHHHAARAMGGRHTGFIVLKQLIYYLNDVRRLPSANMDYVLCYFRPENKFTDRLYTGFAKEQGNPRLCSLDLFSYLTYRTENRTAPLLGGWSLRECSASDLWEWEQFYKHHSGGLLGDVLNLGRRYHEEHLEKAYAKMGFTRKWKAFALKSVGDLKAVVIAEESDAAINLSDLLNGFKVLVMDPNIPPEIIFAAVGELAKNHPVESVPFMIYPTDYAQNQGLNCEKQYYLWILDLQHGNEYLKYLGRRFRMKLF